MVIKCRPIGERGHVGVVIVGRVINFLHGQIVARVANHGGQTAVSAVETARNLIDEVADAVTGELGAIGRIARPLAVRTADSAPESAVRTASGRPDSRFRGG